MSAEFLRSLVFSGLIAIAVAAAGPASAQSAGRDSAAQNVRESQQYERLVCGNPGFRARRIQEECGPINDPQLHQSCLASFDCGPGAPTGRNFRQAPASERIR